MNRCAMFLVISLTSGLTLGNGPAAHEPDHPRVLFRSEESQQYPSFVAADAVLTPEEKVDASLFSPAAVDSINSLLATPPQGSCIRAENYYESYVNPPSRSNLDEAVRSSHMVILGTVVETTFGFSGATPGQLLHLRPDQALKGNAKKDLYFVFVPVGDFSVGSARICKTDTRYATPPEIGEQVLAFVPKLWNSDRAGAFLNTFDEAGIIAIKADGTVSLPRRYLKSQDAATPKRKAELLQTVRNLAAREKE